MRHWVHPTLGGWGSPGQEDQEVAVLSLGQRTTLAPGHREAGEEPRRDERRGCGGEARQASSESLAAGGDGRRNGRKRRERLTPRQGHRQKPFVPRTPFFSICFGGPSFDTSVHYS